MKHCHICGELKPLSAFYRAAGMRDGHRNDCKTCNLAAKAKRYAEDPEPVKERVRRWQRENPERLNEYRRRRRNEPGVKARERAGHLRRKFGITPEQYEAMFVDQRGGCAICGRAPRSGSSLHIDHDHDTGAVRALLCFSCNAAIGHLRDDADRVRRVLSYLDAHDPEVAEMRRLAQERVRALRR